MITDLEHIAIAARDTRMLANFYVDLFGWEIVYDNGKTPATYFVKLPRGDMLEILPMAQEDGEHDRARQGICHIALTTDDFQADVQRLHDHGVRIVEQPTTSAKGVSTVFFLDPEGNLFHYIQRLNKL